MSGEGQCIHVAFCALEANFLELRVCELRRTPIPRTPVNKGKKRAEAALTLGAPARRWWLTYTLPAYYYGPFSAARHESAAQPLSA